MVKTIASSAHPQRIIPRNQHIPETVDSPKLFHYTKGFTHSYMNAQGQILHAYNKVRN